MADDPKQPAAARKKKADRTKREDAIVKDAKDVYEVAKRYRKQFDAADKGKAKKALPPSFWTELADVLRRISGARTKKAAAATGTKDATVKERAQRASLSELLIEVRDEIRDSFPDDPTLGRAFGVGKDLHVDSTPKLIDHADAVLGAIDGDYAKAAKAAGVAKRKAKIQKFRDALEAADLKQQSAQRGLKSATSKKSATLRTLTAAIAKLRKRARTVFRKDKAILAEFATARPAVAKKRATKKKS